MPQWILYNSHDEQSILAKAVGLKKFPSATVTDVYGFDEAAFASAIGGITVDTLDDIVVACASASSHATSKITYDQIALLDSLLKTAKKGTVVRTNTCQANSTKTDIILDSGASASNDFYNGKYIKTAGTTEIYRYISDYVGSSKTAKVVDTGTAITTTETFTIYTNAHIYVVGDKSTNLNPCYVAWTTLYPTVEVPLIIKILGGYSSTVSPCTKYEQTATSVGEKALTHTGQFTANFTNGYNYWVGISSSTLGKGEVKRIKSNTTDALTLYEDWGVRPTGTIKYSIFPGEQYALAYVYLPYAIKTYLSGTTALTQNILESFLDRYNDIELKSAISTYQDLATLDEYIAKGKVIFQAICAGVVS